MDKWYLFAWNYFVFSDNTEECHYDAVGLPKEVR